MATIEELQTELAQACPHWDEMRWGRFLQLTPAEQELEVQTYQDSAEAAPTSAWQIALDILQIAAQVAGDVTGIGGAISAIQNVIHLI